MASCMMVGNCVRVRNYKKKDNSDGSNLTVTDGQGNLIEFIGRHSLPEFPMGTPVTVSFDMSFFNGRPGYLYVDEVKEVKDK